MTRFDGLLETLSRPPRQNGVGRVVSEQLARDCCETGRRLLRFGAEHRQTQLAVHGADVQRTGLLGNSQLRWELCAGRGVGRAQTAESVTEEDRPSPVESILDHEIDGEQQPPRTYSLALVAELTIERVEDQAIHVAGEHLTAELEPAAAGELRLPKEILEQVTASLEGLIRFPVDEARHRTGLDVRAGGADDSER